jgi:hypothetical protein
VHPDIRRLGQAARTPWPSHGARTETVKFVIDLQRGDKTYFLDTRKWEVHFDFVRRFPDPCADFKRFNTREYTQEDRRFVLGSLMHYLDGDHWTVELSGATPCRPSGSAGCSSTWRRGWAAPRA